MERTSHRLFLVENEQARSSSLRKLVDEELIHQIPSAITHRSVSDSHKAYNIDYGNYVDWVATRKTDLSELLNEVVVPTFPKNFKGLIDKFTINIGDISDERGECKECGKVFDLVHPVYRKAKVCPGCGGKKILKR
jgi:hypothetical protein